MAKKYLFLVLILIILSGCQQVNIPDFEGLQNSFPCDTKEEYVDSWTEEQVISFAEEWKKGDIHGEIRRCIENQETAECFLIYAMYNNRPELCQHVPEKVDVEVFTPPSAATGQGGGYQIRTCYYRSACKDFVNIYNQ